MSDVVLRAARAEDRSFLRQLSAEVFARFGDYDLYLPELARQRGVQTVIAELDRAPVGFAMYSIKTVPLIRGELTAIAVVPGRHRQGIGAALLARAEAGVRAQAAGRPAVLELTVAEDNAPARTFFLRSGFIAVPSAPGAYPGGQRSLGMRKDIGGA